MLWWMEMYVYIYMNSNLLSVTFSKSKAHIVTFKELGSEKSLYTYVRTYIPVVEFRGLGKWYVMDSIEVSILDTNNAESGVNGS